MNMEEDYYSHSKPPASAAHHGVRHHGPASTSELMASAKVVAEAARSAISHHNASGIDKARVSEAAEELLDAAKQYGKLESSGIGQYLDKAEDYLHNLHSSSSAAATQPHRRQEHRPARREEEEEEDESPRHGGGGGGDGIGDYIKMAQGFLK